MPSFISHTIMAYDVYNKLDKKNVNLEYMLTYSLGGDLSKYSKCRYDTHHRNQDQFIDNMIDYIKRNKLMDDKEIMGVLYGHISHYLMDSMLHPLIRKVDKACIKNKRNHALIEEYYDNYLVEEKYNTDIKSYLKNNILGGKVSKKIAGMIDCVYIETYGIKRVSRYYKFNLLLYRILRRIYLLFNINFIKKVSGLVNFLENNKDVDLVNNNESKNSLDTLYDECVKKTISYICKIKI